MSRSLFATQLYEAEIDDAGLLDDLAHSIRSLASDDGAGQVRHLRFGKWGGGWCNVRAGEKAALRGGRRAISDDP